MGPLACWQFDGVAHAMLRGLSGVLIIWLRGVVIHIVCEMLGDFYSLFIITVLFNDYILKLIALLIIALATTSRDSQYWYTTTKQTVFIRCYWQMANSSAVCLVLYMYSK